MSKKVENVKGYYNEKVLKKFSDALKEAMKEVKSGAVTTVSISNRNSKMGEVPSVSLLPFLTCPGVCKNTCGAKCYAAKLANLRPSVLKSYARNTALAILKPDLYWMGVDYACKGVRYFRFHVSGDIINKVYLERVIKTAWNNPHCEMLIFTKRFELVNEYIANHGDNVKCIPSNLHILFSGWSNLKPVNPYGLPETNVFTCEDDFDESWKVCGWNCFNCACRGVGCWQAKNGETVAFKMH